MNSSIHVPHRLARAVTRWGIAVPGMFLSLLLVSLLSSCQTHDRITYFQDADQLSDTLPSLGNYAKISNFLELQIIVSAENSAAVSSFNKPLYSSRQFDNKIVNAQSQLQTYLVDGQGCIDFPTLGRIHVAGMTTTELAQLLQNRISEYVKDPIVSIDPIALQIQVLGEVNSPGTIFLPAHQATLIDALARAHDLSLYGDRESVIIIHREGDRQVKHKVDLTSTDVLTDPLCELHQNDIVYVAPNNARRSSARYNSMKQQNLSMISTIVSVVSVLASLSIAIWK